MRQAAGQILTESVLTAAPSDGDAVGFDLTTTPGEAKVSKWLVDLVTTALVDWDLWVQHRESGKWALATSLVQNYAKVNGRAVFVVHDIGIFDRAAIVCAANMTSATIQEYVENNFLRGD